MYVSYLFHGHVLDEASLGSSHHLEQAVLRRDHVEVVRVQNESVLLDEILILAENAL
jgi:hypothetical protein